MAGAQRWGEPDNEYPLLGCEIESRQPGHRNDFRRQLQSIDRDVATSNVKSLEEYLGDSVAPRKFNLRVLTIFAVALLLAVTGIYGVVSYTVTKRTPEIGIRLALSGENKCLSLILGQGLKMVVTGVALGVLGAFAMTRVIRTLLFGITPTTRLRSFWSR